MSQVLITSTTFVNTPYNTYVCDVYGNQCVLVGNIITGQPPTITLILPPQFNNAPAIGIKIIDSLGCEIFKILECSDGIVTTTTTSIPIEKIKEFQDGDDFYFMDNILYEFQS